MDMNYCIERGYLFTSFMLDRTISALSDEKQISAIPYYLYKFRHSINGYYLKPWTIHNFVKKSLSSNSEVIFDLLTHKTQYGVFPDVHTMNILVDHFLKNENSLDAFKASSEIFLQEHLDNEICQALAIESVVKYWEDHLDSDPSFKIEDLKMQRDFAGIIFTVGQLTSNVNLSIIGGSLLGRIEKESGILCVHQDPWGPLNWNEGYLERAVDLLTTSDQKISRQSVEVVKRCCEQSEDLLMKLEEVIKDLEVKDLITDEDEMTLRGICQSMKTDLPQIEEAEIMKMKLIQEGWKKEFDSLNAAEVEIRSEISEKRSSYYKMKEIEEKAHLKAVVQLGFYDLQKPETKEEPEDIELRSNYVDGSMLELDIIERARQKNNIKKDPIVSLA